MSARKKVQPTEAELAILRVLWNQGASTVRDVHESMGGDKRTRYTTTLKQLQVMTDKGFVVRNASQRSHVYAAALNEEETEKWLVSGFIDRVFEGSLRKMVVHALDSENVTNEDLSMIKRLLQQKGEEE